MRPGVSTLKLENVPTIRVYWRIETARKMTRKQAKMQEILGAHGLAQGPRYVVNYVQATLLQEVEKVTMLLPGNDCKQEEREIWPAAQEQQQQQSEHAAVFDLREEEEVVDGDDLVDRGSALEDSRDRALAQNGEQTHRRGILPLCAKQAEVTGVEDEVQNQEQQPREQQGGTSSDDGAETLRANANPIGPSACSHQARRRLAVAGGRIGQLPDCKGVPEGCSVSSDGEEDGQPDLTKEEEEVVCTSASGNPALQAALAKVFLVNLERCSRQRQKWQAAKQQMKERNEAHQAEVQKLQSERDGMASHIALLEEAAANHKSALAKARCSALSEKAELELKLTQAQAQNMETIRELRGQLEGAQSHADDVLKSLNSCKARRQELESELEQSQAKSRLLAKEVQDKGDMLKVAQEQAQALGAELAGSQVKIGALEVNLRDKDAQIAMIWKRLQLWEAYREQALRHHHHHHQQQPSQKKQLPQQQQQQQQPHMQRSLQQLSTQNPVQHPGQPSPPFVLQPQPKVHTLPQPHPQLHPPPELQPTSHPPLPSQLSSMWAAGAPASHMTSSAGVASAMPAGTSPRPAAAAGPVTSPAGAAAAVQSRTGPQAAGLPSNLVPAGAAATAASAGNALQQSQAPCAAPGPPPARLSAPPSTTAAPPLSTTTSTQPPPPPPPAATQSGTQHATPPAPRPPTATLGTNSAQPPAPPPLPPSARPYLPASAHCAHQRPGRLPDLLKGLLERFRAPLSQPASQHPDTLDWIEALPAAQKEKLRKVLFLQQQQQEEQQQEQRQHQGHKQQQQQQQQQRQHQGHKQQQQQQQQEQRQQQLQQQQQQQEQRQQQLQQQQQQQPKQHQGRQQQQQLQESPQKQQVHQHQAQQQDEQQRPSTSSDQGKLRLQRYLQYLRLSGSTGGAGGPPGPEMAALGREFGGAQSGCTSGSKDEGCPAAQAKDEGCCLLGAGPESCGGGGGGGVAEKQAGRCEESCREQRSRDDLGYGDGSRNASPVADGNKDAQSSMGGVGSRNPSPVADGNKDAQSRMGGVGSRNPSPVADGNKDAQSSMGGGAKADQEGSTRDAEECLQGGSRGREEDASFGSELKGILTEMDDDLQRIVDKLSAPDAQRRLTPDAHQGRSKRRRLLPQIQLKNELLSDDNSSGQDQGTSEQQNSDNSCGAEDCLMEQEGDDGCSDLSDAAEEAGKGPLCHGHRHASVPYVKCSLPHCGKTFCAACAWNRNGEDAVASAATGCWVCPCCRDSNGSQGCGAGCSGCCICSRCRKRQGLPPTGLLYSTATASGFSNVHDYLVHNNTGEDAATIQARKQRHWWGRGIVSAQGVRKRAPAGSPKRLLRTRRSRQQCKKHMVGAPSKDGAGGASRADNGSGGNDQQAWVCCELCSKWRCTSPEFATQMADSDAQFRCCMLEGATCGDRCDWEWEEEQFQLLQAAGAEQAALQHQCEAPQTLQAVKLPGSVQEQQPHLLADLKAQELELLQKRRELEQQLQQQQQQQQQ